MLSKRRWRVVVCLYVSVPAVHRGLGVDGDGLYEYRLRAAVLGDYRYDVQLHTGAQRRGGLHRWFGNGGQRQRDVCAGG